MISRAEYLYLKDKVSKIEDVLFNFEVTSPLYKAWDRFNHLNAQEQEEEKAKWDVYYQSCRNSQWGQAFFKLKGPFRAGTVKKADVKRVVEETSSNLPLVVVKPDGVDPHELWQRMGPYFSLRGTLKQIKKVVEEYSPAYERATEKDLL